MAPMSGMTYNVVLEFFDVDEQISTGSVEHFMCNSLQWDPSGRMLASIVTQPMFGDVSVKFTLENGYKLWTFQGKKIVEVPTESFYQVCVDMCLDGYIKKNGWLGIHTFGRITAC